MSDELEKVANAMFNGKVRNQKAARASPTASHGQAQPVVLCSQDTTICTCAWPLTSSTSFYLFAAGPCQLDGCILPQHEAPRQLHDRPGGTPGHAAGLD